MLIREASDGGVRVSLRSRGEVNVGSIAEALGGGGHHNAGGFAFGGDPSAAVAAVLRRIPLA